MTEPQDGTAPDHGTGTEGGSPLRNLEEEAAKMADTLRSWAQQYGGLLPAFSGHIATGAPECKLCPVCRAIAFARGDNPELKEQATAAAESVIGMLHGVLDNVADGKSLGDFKGLGNFKGFGGFGGFGKADATETDTSPEPGKD